MVYAVVVWRQTTEGDREFLDGACDVSWERASEFVREYVDLGAADESLSVTLMRGRAPLG